MTRAGTPAAEIDVGLVKVLIADQFPQCAGWRPSTHGLRLG